MPVYKRRSLRLLAILGVLAVLAMALSTVEAHQSFAISTNGEHKLYLPLATGSAQPRASSESPQYDLINQYRSNAGVPLVSHNPVLESQCYEHSRYMAENGVLSHTQDPHLPYASGAGQTCASQANIWMASGSLAAPWNPDSAIRSWMASIPHRLWLLYPTSREFGYAFYNTQTGQRAAAAVDVLSAANFAADESYNLWPVRYPGKDEKNVPATRYPITLNWRYFGPEPVLNRVRLKNEDGTSIAHEASTELTAGHKGIKIVPKNALPASSRIVVSVSGSYDGQPFSYSWRFQTGPAQ